ncbi:hypothetical protein BJ165DRAFT_225738 [Panaeolus papilionaceus]|nr:hypothetical protein BJ165DRAFT_225738 [Panaeolus papilionaceus]
MAITMHPSHPTVSSQPGVLTVKPLHLQRLKNERNQTLHVHFSPCRWFDQLATRRLGGFRRAIKTTRNLKDYRCAIFSPMELCGIRWCVDLYGGEGGPRYYFLTGQRADEQDGCMEGVIGMRKGTMGRGREVGEASEKEGGIWSGGYEDAFA